MNLNNIKNYKYKILDKKIIDCYSQYLKQKKFSYNKKYFLRNSFTSTLFYIDFSCKLSRAKFEDMCMSYFTKCIEPIEKVIK